MSSVEKVNQAWLNQLTEQQRKIVTMFYRDKMSIGDIAKTLKTNRAVVQKLWDQAEARASIILDEIDDG